MGPGATVIVLLLLLCVPALAEDRQVSLASILGPDKAKHIMDQERALRAEMEKRLRRVSRPAMHAGL